MTSKQPIIETIDGVTCVVVRDRECNNTAASQVVKTFTVSRFDDATTVSCTPWNRPQYIGQVKDSTHVPFYKSLPKFKRRK